MTKDQIEYMVSRFLGWKLPKNFNPDAGISYTPPTYGADMDPEHIRPSGTNLLDGAQAKEMIEYLIEGMPVDTPSAAYDTNLYVYGTYHREIPRRVYWNDDYDNFYSFDHNGMGIAFYEEWYARRAEFPTGPGQ